MDQIHNKENYTRTFVDEELGLLISSWTDFSNEEVLKDSCHAQLAAVKIGKVRYLILDTGLARTAPSPSAGEWMDQFLFPDFDKAGLRAIINVTRKRAPSIISEWCRKQAGKHRFQYIEVESISQARQVCQAS